MSVPPVSYGAPSDSASAGVRDTRLHERWLLLARVGWFVVAAVVIGMDVLGTPATFDQLHMACASSNCLVHQLSHAQLHELLASGVSLDFYAAYEVALSSVGTLVYIVIAAVIIGRRPDDRMAMLGAYTLLLFGAGTVFGALNALPGSNAAWALPVSVATNAGPLAFYAFFCLFPSGHFVPTWFRWVALAWLIGSIAVLIPYAPLQLLVGGTLPFFVFFGLLVFTQVYRYRKVSTPLQREQTKWVVLGFVAGMGGFLVLLGIAYLVVPGTAFGILVDTALSMSLWLIPISIGIAILRSRLWDIDVLINRALVYGSLTALLAAVYFAMVIGMQSLTAAVTGQKKPQPVIIVASTLLIAALFTPLRRRLQATIDRRFYRRKYDAARTLATFSATLRSEVELSALQQHLVTVVAETMQPVHVSLWLRLAERRESRQE